MKKRFNVITVAVLMTLMGLVTYVITYYWVQSDLNTQLEKYNRQRRELSAFYEAMERIDESFIGETDKQKQVEGAISGLVESLGDKWSSYMDPVSYQQLLAQQANNYVGIGITVEDNKEGALLIKEVMKDSPAETAGLLVGDIITHVGGEAVAELGFNAAVDKVLGDEFTNVTLTVARPSEGEGGFTLDVMRRTILREVVVSQIFDNIGYIKVANFEELVDEDFIEAVNNLVEAEVTGLIIDVRNNPGGKLSVLEKMLDCLLPEGVLITLRYKDGREDVRTSAAACVELPMVVLINEDSVSAAEFFAACLREYDYAALVGENTTGKGYAQEHYRLSDGSGLYLSTSEFFTPSGKSLAGVGLTPDVEVALSDSERQTVGSMDPEQDRQLARALQILK